MNSQSSLRVKAINELGKIWKGDSRNIVDRDEIEGEIWTLARAHILSQLKHKRTFENLDEEIELFDNIFFEVMLEARNSFDPAKGELSSFLTYRVLRRFFDKIQKMKNGAFSPVSLEMHEDTKGAIKDQKLYFNPIEVEDILNRQLLELTAQILNFSDKHNKKNGSETKRAYFKLFYTIAIIDFLQMEIEEPNIIYKKEIQNAVQHEFINYCMKKVQEKWTVSEIFGGELKLFGEIYLDFEQYVSSKKTEYLKGSKYKLDEEIPIPMPDIVGISYWSKYKKTITQAAYSQQKQIYKEEMREALYPKWIR